MKRLALLLACLTAVIMPMSVSAQEESAEVAEPAELEYGSGEVITVDAAGNKIVVDEYDIFSDTAEQHTYVVNESTEFEGISSLNDIAVGSYAEIDYTVAADGTRIANVISVYESQPEEPADTGTEDVF